MFSYFGYGSNMELTSLRAKGVEPLCSEQATLHGWTLMFNVPHWFRNEGGVGNIRRTDDPRARVIGVMHQCEDEAMARLDTMEAYGIGYDRIEVELETQRGPAVAVAYIGFSNYTDDSCRPSQRYLNILIKGAVAAGLPEAYIDGLRTHPTHPNEPYPPFEPPEGGYPEFTAASLAAHSNLTALAGSVFDMTGSRWQLDFPNRHIFAGRDTTLFHLARLDSSDGRETIEDLAHDRLNDAQRRYLNEYLHEYDKEYRYVGRFIYTQ